MDNRAWVDTSILAISDIAPWTLHRNANRDIMPPTRSRIGRRRITHTTSERRHRQGAIPSSTNPSSDTANETDNTSMLPRRTSYTKIPASSASLVPWNSDSHNSPSISADSRLASSHDTTIPMLARRSGSSPYKADRSTPWNDLR